jgi:hypothetical protein
MMNNFLTLIELAFCVTCPITFDHVVLCSNGIMSYQPQPNFNFQRDFCLPQMSKRLVYAIAAKKFIHGFHTELTISKQVCHFQSSEPQYKEDSAILSTDLAILHSTIS